MRFNKSIILLLILTFVLVFSLSSQELFYIATGEFPPYFSNKGDISFLTELFNEIGEVMDAEFSFSFMSWKRCEHKVEYLEAWGAVPYVKTEEREKTHYFTDPVFHTNAKLFFIKSDKDKIKQISKYS